METKNALIAQLRVDYQHIMTHIGLLNEALSQSKIISLSAVHQLPNPEKEDIGANYQHIKSESLFAEQAFDKYTAHLLSVKLNQNRVGLMSVRLPGCIMIETSQEKEIRERIEVINALKKTFDGFIQTHAGKSQDERFENVSQAVPDLVRKALSRNILVSPAQTTHVSYSWSHSMSTSKPLHKKEWDKDKRLDNAIAFKQNHPNAEHWRTAIEIERAALHAVNDTSFFKIKRPLRVVPTMNVKYRDDESQKNKKTTYIAHTPLLVINDSPKLFLLKDYNGSTRKEICEEVPVIERLHLYKA